MIFTLQHIDVLHSENEFCTLLVTFRFWGDVMAVAEFRLLYSALAAIYGEVSGKYDSERV